MKTKRKTAAKAAKVSATVLVLRTCAANMSSYGGFVWPSNVGAVVEAPDWSAVQECGNGLHGWLYGQGDHTCSTSAQSPDAKWLVLEVDSALIVELGGKVKFPRCIVRHVGDKHSATAYLIEHEPRSRELAVIGATRNAPDGAVALAGYSGTATAGYSGTLILRQWDAKAERSRTRIAYVGEDGIKANTPYRLDENGEFVEVAK